MGMGMGMVGVMGGKGRGEQSRAEQRSLSILHMQAPDRVEHVGFSSSDYEFGAEDMGSSEQIRFPGAHDRVKGRVRHRLSRQLLFVIVVFEAWPVWCDCEKVSLELECESRGRRAQRFLIYSIVSWRKGWDFGRDVYLTSPLYDPIDMNPFVDGGGSTPRTK